MICGLKDEAKFYLSKFSWGHSFLELNEEILELYSNCKNSSEEVLEVQRKFLEDSEKERENKNYDDMWPTSSESEAESEEGGWWRML